MEVKCENCGALYVLNGSAPKTMKCFCSGIKFKTVKN